MQFLTTHNDCSTYSIFLKNAFLLVNVYGVILIKNVDHLTRVTIIILMMGIITTIAIFLQEPLQNIYGKII